MGKNLDYDQGLTRIDTEHGRWYLTPNGDKYPSVTTILSHEEHPRLTEWKDSMGAEAAASECERAARRGTKLHKAAELYLNYREIIEWEIFKQRILTYSSKQTLGLLCKIKMDLDKITNIRAQEIKLYSDTLQAAGTADCIADYKGVLSLIDFKSANKPKRKVDILDYFIQTTMYSIMFNELHGELPEQLVIIMSPEQGVPAVFVEPLEPYVVPMFEKLEEYYLDINT